MEKVNTENWKELDFNVDSLWLINERDKSGKHANVYHGNFVPQIPNQLIRRYTSEKELVLMPYSVKRKKKNDFPPKCLAIRNKFVTFAA